jgi:5-formyltetrahydrofolate cyclo-ligase
MKQPDLRASKKTWRDWAKAKRSTLDMELLSKEVEATISSSSLYKDAQHILSYLAFGNELKLSHLHKDSEKLFYVTRTHFKPEPHLSIHKLTKQLEQHRFGYWQPLKEAALIDPKTIDLVLVPGLCFDKLGSRLGYGMGFYDRLLSQLRPKAAKLAVTLEPLVVEDLPQESWDFKMTHLATEKALYVV